MDDRLFYPLLAVVVAAMIALALVWPQGQGAPSPPPFGHPIAPAATPTSPANSPTAPSPASMDQTGPRR